MPSVAASFDVLSLRRGEALQRWKEISLNVPQNYRAQIKAHFGVDVGENMSGMSTYVGGDSSSLDISEVVNTNLQSGDTSSEAVIAGKGVGSSQGSERFEARDWGVLMCIYHNVPLWIMYRLLLTRNLLFLRIRIYLFLNLILLVCNLFQSLCILMVIMNWLLVFLPLIIQWVIFLGIIVGRPRMIMC